MARNIVLKDAISSLSIKKHFKLQNPSGIGLQPPIEQNAKAIAQLNLSSDQNKLSVNQSEIKISSDRNDLSLNQSEIKSSSDQFHSGLSGKNFDVISFFPSPIGIELVERSNGVFQIPHRIFEFALKATSTKVELLIFMCLLRFTLGFKKAQCQLSQTAIARWTGVAASNIRKGLKNLIKSGLIVRKEDGLLNHTSAMYHVPVVKAFLEYDAKIKNNSTQSSLSLNQSELKSISDQSKLSLNQSQNSVQNELRTQLNLSSIKESINKELNKTLSQEYLPENIKQYFETLKPEKKRESEFNAFLSLKKDYVDREITDCVEYLKAHGLPGSKEPCHSPMAFLSVGIKEVLESLKVAKDKAHRKETNEKQLIEAKKQKEEQEKKELEGWQKKEEAFYKTFTDVVKQEALILEFTKKLHLHPKSEAARCMAISNWWEANSKVENVFT
ncbi:MAG: replication protein [Deltaproteobacteria bacterium]|nr:replication protein [Deltaproteobacteria bacterium]